MIHRNQLIEEVDVLFEVHGTHGGVCPSWVSERKTLP